MLSRLALGSNVQKHAYAKLAVRALAFCFRKGGRRADQQAGRQTSKQAGRQTSRQAYWQAGRHEAKSLTQSEQCRRARRGKQGGHKTNCHILTCDRQRKKAYGNRQSQFWRKRLRNHRSVITNLE